VMAQRSCAGLGCWRNHELAGLVLVLAGQHQPAAARAPCPPSLLGLRRHARGPQPVQAPATVSISPDPPDLARTASPARLRCSCAQGTPHQLPAMRLTSAK
jgi:hypothetical protein